MTHIVSDSDHHLCRTCHDWRGSLFFPTEILTTSKGATLEKEVILKQFDLCQVLSRSAAHQHSLRKYSGFPPGSRFRFHPKYNGAENKGKLVSDIQHFARLSGYDLPIGITRPAGGNRLITVALKCHYATPYRGPPKTKSFSDDMVMHDDDRKPQAAKDVTNQEQPRRNTKRPIDPNAKCPFGIVVFLYRDNCWYLSMQDDLKSIHKHHLKRNPEQMPSMLRGQVNRKEDLLNDCSVELISDNEASNQTSETCQGQGNVDDDTSSDGSPSESQDFASNVCHLVDDERAEAFKVLDETWKLVESYPDLRKQLLADLKLIHAKFVKEIKARQDRKREATEVSGNEASIGSLVHDKKTKSTHGHSG